MAYPALKFKSFADEELDDLATCFVYEAITLSDLHNKLTNEQKDELAARWAGEIRATIKNKINDLLTEKEAEKS